MIMSEVNKGGRPREEPSNVRSLRLPLSIILVAVYYSYSDKNKKNFRVWVGTLTRRKDNY